MCIVTSLNKDSVSLTEIKSAHIIIGTSCAGTGLDTGVEYIIVVGLPFSIEQLLQWAGRCRINGTVSVLVPSFHLKKDNELSGKDAIGIKICHHIDEFYHTQRLSVAPRHPVKTSTYEWFALLTGREKKQWKLPYLKTRMATLWRGWCAFVSS